MLREYDASGEGVEYRYHRTSGHPERTVKAGRTSHEYHAVMRMNARGQVTTERVGGITRTRSYLAQTGRVSRLQAGSNNSLQDLSYAYDRAGNVKSHARNTGSRVVETFEYDRLNRLTSASMTGALTLSYYASGNIRTKSNVSTSARHTYGAGLAGPHAVTSVGTRRYGYDANGNMTSDDGRTITHAPYDKPARIAKGGHAARFRYGPNRARFHRADTSGSSGTSDTSNTSDTNTYYVGNVEHIVRGNAVETKRHLAGGSVIVIKKRPTSAAAATTRELLRFLSADVVV